MESEQSESLLTDELFSGPDGLEVTDEAGLDAYEAVLSELVLCISTEPTHPPSSMSPILLPLASAGFQIVQLLVSTFSG